MDQNNSILDIGKLAEPAKVLIERVSDAVGGVFKPYQIRRVAEAEAEAEKLKALNKIEISELQQRALSRFMIEEASKQNNIESITRKAVLQLETGSKPANLDRDWMVDFFDKSRLISDESMQDVWARILAGEANKPGTFSKRTLHLMASLDKSDAVSFNKLCNFIWTIQDDEVLIFDSKMDIYEKNGISFAALKHLDSIGLISFESISAYQLSGIPKKMTIRYHDIVLNIEFSKNDDNHLSLGHVLLTNAGAELSSICKKEKIEGFVEYIKGELSKQNVKVA